MNFWIIFVAAVVPTITGLVWYNPKVFGTAWMKAANLTEERLKQGNMPVIILVSLLLSVFLGMQLMMLTIHQSHVNSLFADLGDDAAAMADLEAFMAKYGTLYRTFKHGVLHGVMSGLFFALPVIGINAMFERRGWKYIFIHTGYWMLTMGLMGGIICQWL
jgi:hypothetical protein